jgi:hypothetical protein
MRTEEQTQKGRAGGRRPGARIAAVMVAAVATLAVTAGGASAAAPTGLYSSFANCPYANTSVVACLYSETTSGSFKLGNATVPINKKIVLQGGIAQDPVTYATSFVNASNGVTLSKTSLDVPGGLSGLISSSQLSGAALLAYQLTIGTANDVKATAELVGNVGYDFLNYVNQSGPALTLPLRIHLENPFLGSTCYIGSAAHPVTLKLTTGTSGSLSGSFGAINYLDLANLITADGFKLVDSSFSVPSASGCGGLFSLIINPLVNLKEGIPAATGNAAVLQGSLKQGDAEAVRASVH